MGNLKKYIPSVDKVIGTAVVLVVVLAVVSFTPSDWGIKKYFMVR